MRRDNEDLPPPPPPTSNRDLVVHCSAARVTRYGSIFGPFRHLLGSLRCSFACCVSCVRRCALPPRATKHNFLNCPILNFDNSCELSSVMCAQNSPNVNFTLIVANSEPNSYPPQ
eukprot:TRINITY_DN8312_c0_g1_i1.p1 TRINITY_DN8312_c0_g1~~TRINITY_DN8312_c0_g1_i1.p1  ORF type:complete len:115 (-),score=5.59 TRINITY_DN8312_c0_g1_i1:156-500(-)